MTSCGILDAALVDYSLAHNVDDFDLASVGSLQISRIGVLHSIVLTTATLVR